MIRKTAVLSLAALFMAAAALASDLNTCPMKGVDAKGSKATCKVGKTTVHFCCNNCKAAFGKLSKKDQAAKIKAAMKPTKKADAGSVKLTSVNVCPITGEKVNGAGGGSSVCGKYEVHFCCAGCKPAFEKLSASEKEAKIQEALKKS